jgi:hypothetical protein
MAAAIPADWSEIRTMFSAGAEFQEISRVTGIAIGTLKTRSHREGWTRKAVAQKAAEIRQTRVESAVTGGQILSAQVSAIMKPHETRPQDTLLEQLGKESRILAAKATRNALSHAASLSGEEALAAARPIKDITGATAIVHRWEQDKQGIEVNIYANQERYADAVEIEAEVIDDDSTE